MKGSAGGKVMAIRQRKEAIDVYNASPNKCLKCGKAIEVGNKKVADVRKQKFYDQSCSASFNNLGKLHEKKWREGGF